MNNDQSRSIYDQCYIQNQVSDNNSKLKYITNNFIDLVRANEDDNFFKIDYKDGLYIPASKIDNETPLIHSELTNFRERTQLGQLPLATLPGMYMQNAYGDPAVEEFIREGISTVNKTTCNPKYDNFYDRTFPIFTKDAPEPLPISSVETWRAGGDPTRDSKYQSFRK